MTTPPPSFHLVVSDPAGERGRTRLVDGQRITIGRAPTNHIVVYDERASRAHAEILPSAAGWVVRDLESRNGTLLNGEPFEADRPLAPGDVISVGLTEIVYVAGDPPPAVAGGDDTRGESSTGRMPAELEAWHTSITHRQTRSQLLEEIREAAATVPRVGRAAAELCRLAFALGRATDLHTVAKLALEAAAQGTSSSRGVVLLPGRLLQPAAPRRDLAVAGSLEAVASVPAAGPAGEIPVGVVTAVLRGNEALLIAAGTTDGSLATISAPVRMQGKPIGVMHLAIDTCEHQAGPDELEFVMAVCEALGLALDNITAREALSTKLASAADENERLRRRLGDDCQIVGRSPALQGILAQVQRVAATRATVLVRGESGSGKELVARAIHESSDRREGPFVCLNCAALSETLLESELFGHEKGAFTGATERKIGKFEAAHGGTLMLDEIGEMSPEVQAKFLRVLEGHPFERVGGSGRVQVDVRVVAATNRNLEAAVATGGFRRDLYFRLKVVEIVVPPLRQRAEDIAAIAGHFLERFAAETGRRIRGFTPAAITALETHHWPGNIRELRNCVERAVVLAPEEWVDVADLALSHLSVAGDSGRAAHPAAGHYVPETISEVERRHILNTLAAVGGNKTKAATILGIERSTLDRKLAKWAGG